MLRLNDLKKESMVAVHFVLLSDLFGIDLSQALALKVFEASIGDVKSDKELLTIIAHTLQFPDYFGNNWDALDECLGDMDWVPADGYVLVLHDAAKAWSQSPYVLGRLVMAWLEAAEYWVGKATPFHLVFVM